jgi:hypothetical protein
MLPLRSVRAAAWARRRLEVNVASRGAENDGAALKKPACCVPACVLTTDTFVTYVVLNFSIRAYIIVDDYF